MLPHIIRQAFGEGDEIGRDHQHGRRAVLGADFRNHLHAAEFQRGGVVDHLRRRRGELGGGFELGFGLDDAGAFFADGLGLHRHHLLHGRGQLDVLHLEALDLEAPALRRVDHAVPQKPVDLVALLQHFVKVMLADDVAKAGERQLVDRRLRVDDGNDGLGGVADVIPQHGVDADRHAVARDGLLLLRGDGARADVDGERALDAERDDPVKPRAAQARVAPEPEDDAALVFLRDAKAGEEDEKRDDDVGRDIHDEKSFEITGARRVPCPVRRSIDPRFCSGEENSVSACLGG